MRRTRQWHWQWPIHRASNRLLRTLLCVSSRPHGPPPAAARPPTLPERLCPFYESTQEVKLENRVDLLFFGLLCAASSRRRSSCDRLTGSVAANSSARCVASEFMPNIKYRAPVAGGRRAVTA